MSWQAYQVAQADPGWQAAHDEIVSDGPPGESATARAVRCMLAARRIYEIEKRAELELTPDPGGGS